MSDRVDNNGEMLSKNIAVSIANDTEIEITEERLAPLVDAAHRLLEGGADEDLVRDVLLDLTHELLRADMRTDTYEEDDEAEDFVPKGRRTNLFDSRAFDDADEE